MTASCSDPAGRRHGRRRRRPSTRRGTGRARRACSSSTTPCTCPTGCASPWATGAATPTSSPGRPTGSRSRRSRWWRRTRSAPSRWSGPRSCAPDDGPVAALRQLRDAGHQALVGRRARGRHPEGLALAPRRTVLPGDDLHAVKDPVVRRDARGWHLWASVHPLDDPDATDRMTTEYATSPDGLDWTGGAPRSRRGPAPGTRAGCGSAPWCPSATSSSRPTTGARRAAENWEERTGPRPRRRRTGASPPWATRRPPSRRTRAAGLRYVAVADVAGVRRLYWEATRADGAHELRTEVLLEAGPAGRGMSLPDFLIIGAPKTGTSALHEALARAPASCSCRRSRSRSTSSPTARRRRPAVGPATSRPGASTCGAARTTRRCSTPPRRGRCAARARCSTSTTGTPRSASRTCCPTVRLIAVLRDPVERAHSNWSHLREAGLEPEADFLAACRAEAARRDGGLGALLALRRPRAATASSSTTSRGWSTASGSCCCATATCATSPSPPPTASARSWASRPGGSTGIPRHHVRPDVSGRSGGGPSADEREALLPGVRRRRRPRRGPHRLGPRRLAPLTRM